MVHSVIVRSTFMEPSQSLYIANQSFVFGTFSGCTQHVDTSESVNLYSKLVYCIRYIQSLYVAHLWNRPSLCIQHIQAFICSTFSHCTQHFYGNEPDFAYSKLVICIWYIQSLQVAHFIFLASMEASQLFLYSTFGSEHTFENFSFLYSHCLQHIQSRADF